MIEQPFPEKRVTPEQIFKEVRRGRWSDSQFRELQRLVGDELLFEGLLMAFAFPAAGSALGYQQEAGRLLQDLRVKCPLGAIALLKRTLPHWSVSARGLPFYAAGELGIQAVVDAIDEYAVDPEVSELERRKLEAWRYWLGIYHADTRRST